MITVRETRTYKDRLLLEPWEDQLLSTVAGPQRAVIPGTEGPDDLEGTSGDDEINGGAGSDYIRGGAGNDTINGGDETAFPGDLIDGGDGDDTINGGTGNDILIGGLGRDTINGGDGSDTLAGHGVRFDNVRTNTSFIQNVQTTFYSGQIFDRSADDGVADILNGGGGDDSIVVGTGDVADGGEGTDTVVASFANRGSGIVLDLSSDAFARLAQATGATLSNFERFSVIGSGFGDTFTGSGEQDSFDGGGGNDQIIGGGGNDSLTGGTGSDVLYGDDGNDSLISSEYSHNLLLPSTGPSGQTSGARFDDGVRDDLFGGAGNDSFTIGVNDQADGGEGNDTLSVTLVRLTAGVVVDLRTNLFADLARVGNLTLSNLETVNTVVLTDFADVLYAPSATSSNLYGLGGNDIIYGSNTVQFMGGNEGDDTLDGQGGDDRLWGGDGRDTLLGGAGNDFLYGDLDNDTLQRSYSNEDYLDGGAGNDNLFGGGGNDVLVGGAGNDRIEGGDGFDTASFFGASTGVTVSLTAGTATGEGNDVLVGVEHLAGSRFNDQLTGDGGVNILFGGTGDDLLFGEAGNDFLWGSSGNDTMDGGAGTDTLFLDGAASAFTVSRLAGGGYRISGFGQTDIVTNVERVSFNQNLTSITMAEFEQQAFDPYAYMVANPDIYAAYGISGTAAARNHYFTSGVNEGRDPGSFDALAYIASNFDLLLAYGTDVARATEHYIGSGRNEGRATNTFDALIYAASNIDLALAFGTDADAAARHYIGAGYFEGRSTTGFNPLLYAASNPDVARVIGADPLAATLEYLTLGARSGRPVSGFDPLIYAASNLDLALAFGANPGAALLHYLQSGVNEGRPTTGFDPLAYAAANLDLAQAFGIEASAALRHYLEAGVNEGRVTSGFDAVAYLLTNPDLAGRTASAALLHWLGSGADEGRSGDALFGRDQAGHGLNGTTAGTLESAGDRDWFQAGLTGGTRVSIDLTGTATTVELYDSLGNRIASASGQPANVFDIAATGSYYVVVYGAAGSFTVTATPVANAPALADKAAFEPLVLPGVDAGADVKGDPERDAFVLPDTVDPFVPLFDDQGVLDLEWTVTTPWSDRRMEVLSGWDSPEFGPDAGLWSIPTREDFMWS